MTKETLNKHFVAWFYNENWVDNYNRNGWMRDHFDNRDADARHYWMLEAFMAGFKLKQTLELEEQDKMMDALDLQLNPKAVWPFPEESTT